MFASSFEVEVWTNYADDFGPGSDHYESKVYAINAETNEFLVYNGRTFVWVYFDSNLDVEDLDITSSKRQEVVRLRDDDQRVIIHRDHDVC